VRTSLRGAIGRECTPDLPALSSLEHGASRKAAMSALCGVAFALIAPTLLHLTASKCVIMTAKAQLFAGKAGYA
jgi:hypothetical protein